MSNYLAIAAVTETLRHMIQSAVEELSPGVQFSLDRPDVAAKKSGTYVNIYLYRVEHNTALRNLNVPTRRSDGTLVEKPSAALDLHYLISFFGGDSVDDVERELEAQKLLGGTVVILEEQPILSRAMIRELAAGDDETLATLLTESGIAEQLETVRITPMHLNLEELSKLWSVFFQTPYTLSVAYQCSLVLLESDRTPERALPVKGTGIRAVPFSQAVIAAVNSDDGAPLTESSLMVIRGSSLKGESVVFRMGGAEAALPNTVVKNSEVRVDLSDAGLIDPTDLRAGVQTVQLLYRVEMELGDPDSLRMGWASNPFPVMLHPTVDGSAQANDPEFGPVLNVDLGLPVDRSDKVKLLLNRDGGPPQGYVLAALERTATVSTVTFPIDTVESGTWLMRVSVNGAESLLEEDGDGLYTGPAIMIA